MESSGGATTHNWSEAVEDLVHAGEVDEAISFLESRVSNLESELVKEELQNKNVGNPSFSIADQLSTALHDLSKLYSGEGFSSRAEETLSRSLQIKHRKGGLWMENQSISDESQAQKIEGYGESSSKLNIDGSQQSEDDWETLADRAPEELLSPQSLPGISSLSLEDSEDQHIKRRGRGPFSSKTGLYSDYLSAGPLIDVSEDDSKDHTEQQAKTDLKYGTSHVLVLADFPRTTKRTDLDKLMEEFKDLFVIRWVNDTTLLAIFRTPPIALKALNSIRWPFSVRVLSEDDELLSSIPPKDLEPPRQRPKTDVRTANRLIERNTGIKLPSKFGSAELRRQEEARKNRIISRQKMRDEAWGGDDDDNDHPKPK